MFYFRVKIRGLQLVSWPSVSNFLTNGIVHLTWRVVASSVGFSQTFRNASGAAKYEMKNVKGGFILITIRNSALVVVSYCSSDWIAHGSHFLLVYK
jgi:hypothetical protein